MPLALLAEPEANIISIGSISGNLIETGAQPTIVYVSNSTCNYTTATCTPTTSGMYTSTSPWTSTCTSTSTTTAVFGDVGAAYFTVSGNAIQVYGTLTSGQPYVPPKPKRGPLIKKAIRSSIKRAMKLIDNFGMSNDIRVFLAGQDIEVSHPDSLYKFVLQKKYHSLLHGTEYPGFSTPYGLSLYTKTDVHVADLCVYMDKTPVLDQILALSMFIKTGNEDQLLEKANFRCLSKNMELRKALSLGSPIMQKKLRVTDTDIETGDTGIFIPSELNQSIIVNGTCNYIEDI